MLTHHALATLPLFSGLAPALTGELSQCAQIQSYAADEDILALDAPIDRLAIILVGEVRKTLVSATGHQVVVGVFGPGEVITELNPIDGQTSHCRLSAVTATHTVAIPRVRVLPMLARHPVVTLRLLELLAERQRQALARVAEVRFLSVSSRLAKWLLKSAGHPEVSRLASLELEVPSQRWLARQLAARPDAVRKALNQLQDRSLIAVRSRRLTLLHPAMLAAAARRRSADVYEWRRNLAPAYQSGA